LDVEISQEFEALERYIDPLIGSNQYSQLTEQENQVLALQAINRINLRIGRAARCSKDGSDSFRLLQTHVNNVTVALKREDRVLLKHAVASLRGVLRELNPKSS
jgi:hypothetical protein